jgi:tetratricopeptide (TPR) repeat protein
MPYFLMANFQLIRATDSETTLQLPLAQPKLAQTSFPSAAADNRGGVQTQPFPPGSTVVGGLAVLTIAALATYGVWQWRQVRRRLRSVQETPPFDWRQAEFGDNPIDIPQSRIFNVQPGTVVLPDPDRPINSESPKMSTSNSFSEVPPDRPTPADGESASDHSPEENPRQRYMGFVDDTIAHILKGQIRSKEQVYQLLINQVKPGTGEIFERVLEERATTLQRQLANETDELKQAKAQRQMRAMKTLQDSWEQWQKNYQAQNTCAAAVEKILNAAFSERWSVLVQILDPNQNNVFDHPKIQQLAQALEEASETLTNESEAFEIRQFALGLKRGLASFEQLEGSIVSWMYEPQHSVGFEATKTVYGPWNTWAKQVSSPLAVELFTGQAQNQSAAAVALTQPSLDISAWVELLVLLRGLQNGLVKWLDQQPYSLQGGRHMAGVTFMVFAMIWCELSNGFHQSLQLPESDCHRLSQICFQVALQILRTFAQRDNFPLYGGVFASFSGEGFRETITYLDQPLKKVENTQEKARILTVLGYSQRRLGNREQAIALHQEALNLARQAGDQPCEIANLNHISRLTLDQKDFSTALAHAQRALILARQIGERQGEANALVSLGYSEIMIARQQEAFSSEELEPSISYLEQGQKLAEKLHDVQNSALCCVGLGIAHVAIEQASRAQQFLEQGLSLTQQIGDRDLQALTHTYLGEACYQLNQLDQAVYHACLGMYLLEQRHNTTWKQAAALVVILQGRLGSENFAKLLEQQRSKFIMQIGVDGFDHLPVLIQHYRQG